MKNAVHKYSYCFIGLCVAFFVAGFLYGCGNRGSEPDESAEFTCFREIPGINDADIRAIEGFQAQGQSFVLGMHPTTEIFLANNEIKGFAALLCDWLTELLGIPFTPQIIDWGDLLAGLESHAIDFTATLSPTNERMQTYIMTDAVIWHTIRYFTIPEVNPLYGVSADCLPRYAFLEGTVVYETVAEHIPYSFEAVFFNDYHTVYAMLQNGQINAFFDKDTAEGSFGFLSTVNSHHFDPLLYVPVSLATQNPSLAPVINVVQKALQAGAVRYLVGLYSQGYQDYLFYKLLAQLTDEEIRFINDNPVIKVGMENSNYPVSFFDDRLGTWQGIAIDVLGEIERYTGLRFESANDTDASFADLLRIVESGEAAIITEVFRTPERERMFLFPENSFMTVNPALISHTSHRNITLNEILYMRIGLIRDYAHSALFMQWFPNHYYLSFFESNLEAFDALDRGELDMVMASDHDLLILTHYLERPGYKINYLFHHIFESTFGINRDEVILHSIISKAMRMIDMPVITEQWMRRTYDYRIMLLQRQMPWVIGTAVMLFIVVLCIAVAYFVNAKKRRTITEQSVLLTEALVQSTAASKAKGDFLSNMSHEMRTPMNAIIGMASIGKKANKPDDKNAAFDKIDDASSHLLGLINDILDMAKIEADKLDLMREAFNFERMVKRAVAFIQFRAEERKQRLSIHIDERIPVRFVGDEQRFIQVVTNLLSNAVKFSHENGEIRLDISLVRETAHACELRISVSDDGIGIPPEQQDKLFTTFEQLQSSTSREFGGTGLGLAITKRIIEKMGGEIEVKSEINKGATFTITVWVDRSTESDADEGTADDIEPGIFEGKTMLLAEDVEINREILIALLTETGLRIDCAENGLEALNMVMADPGKYDIVFMDLQMPQMDGIEATNKIRSAMNERVNKLPIIAITANVFMDDIEMCLEAGMNGHLSKPYNLTKVMETLKKYLNK
ncbi:MAG: ATP-binding protein [Defluviitaleaceae bacterium]|nr:ATP-binding protein [Defluviitaleaceae bacterium]